jgi:hypothetical protein
MNSYEYLFTAIIIFSILIASTTLIISISQPSISFTTKEQLQTTAQKIMTQLLLEAGTPPDWGSRIDIYTNDITTFGLAKYGETTRDAYVLDPDKVMRLDSSHPLFIQPSNVINLLNLGNDYGFILSFTTALNVKINETQPGAYNACVTSDYAGLPIAGANVTAKMYYLDEYNQIASTNQTNTNTNVAGNCSINFGISPENRITLFVIDYYGICVMNIDWTNVARDWITGDNWLLYEAEIENATEIIEIMVNKKTINGIYTHAIEHVNYAASKETMEPTTIAILALSNDSQLIFASRLPIPEASEEARLIYSTIPEATSPPILTYSLQRSISISGSAYTMELKIWRMSW